MRIYLILFLLSSFNINADELDVFFEALNKDYFFNEIVYENELAIQKSNGVIIKKMNQFEVHIKQPFEESYYVSETEINHIDHDLDQKQTIPMEAINSPLIKAFLSPTKTYLKNLNIEIIDNLYLLTTETQTIEFLTKGNQIKKIIFLDNLGYRHEIALALKHG